MNNEIEIEIRFVRKNLLKQSRNWHTSSIAHDDSGRYIDCSFDIGHFHWDFHFLSLVMIDGFRSRVFHDFVQQQV